MVFVLLESGSDRMPQPSGISDCHGLTSIADRIRRQRGVKRQPRSSTSSLTFHSSAPSIHTVVYIRAPLDLRPDSTGVFSQIANPCPLGQTRSPGHCAFANGGPGGDAFSKNSRPRIPCTTWWVVCHSCRSAKVPTLASQNVIPSFSLPSVRRCALHVLTIHVSEQGRGSRDKRTTNHWARRMRPVPVSNEWKSQRRKRTMHGRGTACRGLTLPLQKCGRAATVFVIPAVFPLRLRPAFPSDGETRS